MFLNEEIVIKIDKKLKDAIHDIVILLKENEYYDLGSLSNILRHQYDIYITPDLLERFFTLWKDNKDTIFNKKDKKWLYWNSVLKIVENNFLKSKQKPSLGKSKRELKRKEEEELYNNIKKDGWFKLPTNKFIYRGSKSFNLSKDDVISITEYEKDKYSKGSNPIKLDLVKKIFDLSNAMAIILVDFVKKDIKKYRVDILYDNGPMYYFESFKILLKIGDSYNLKYKDNWIEYAPSRIKQMYLKRKKREKYEKDFEERANKNLIEYPILVLQELKNIIDINKKYFLIVNKYDTNKELFMIKKLIYGYFTISEDTYEDGYYKIVMRLDKDGEDIIFFNSIDHFKKCLDDGLKIKDNMVFNIIPENEFNKLKVYFKELKRYKGWDEYLDVDLSNKLKNEL